MAQAPRPDPYGREKGPPTPDDYGIVISRPQGTDWKWEVVYRNRRIGYGYVWRVVPRSYELAEWFAYKAMKRHAKKERRKMVGEITIHGPELVARYNASRVEPEGEDPGVTEG